MIWVWTCSLPVTVLNSPNVTAHNQPAFGTGRDIAGVILYALGFFMEAVSDVQKYGFRSKPENKGKVCDIGLFKWTRHPNYFGEIIIQFGNLSPSIHPTYTPLTHPTAIFTIAVSPAAYSYLPPSPHAALYATILGPFFLTLLLMFVSGLPLQERPGAKKRYESGNHWEHYKAYTKCTSILIPFPPRLYEGLPIWVKRTVLLEFPLYVFDPVKHADGGKVGETEEEGGVEREDV